MINFDLIQAGIIVGSAPSSPADVARLIQLKVSAVICLQDDQDFLDRDVEWSTMQGFYSDNNLPAYRYPIIDFDEADLAHKLVEPIRKLHVLLSTKEKVYVHCNSGICRAPAVVLGYLCHYEGMSIEGGLSQIRIARPIASPFRSAVKEALLELSELE